MAFTQYYLCLLLNNIFKHNMLKTTSPHNAKFINKYLIESGAEISNTDGKFSLQGRIRLGGQRKQCPVLPTSKDAVLPVGLVAHLRI